MTTAQHPQHDDERDAIEQADPIGPITLPKRSKVGARALALVGTASVAALAVQAFADTCTTLTTISNPQSL